jgi:VanZ family protein
MTGASGRTAAVTPAERAATLAGAWMPALVWVGVIFWLSSDRFSDEQTAEWLAHFPLLAALGLPPQLVDVVNLIVRKCAHFVEYAILGLLAYRALRATRPRAAARGLLALAVGASIGVAAVDELHQTRTLTRSGSANDFAINGLGALNGALGAVILHRHRGRRRARAPRA